MSINILYLINSLDVGGAEQAMVRLVSNLDKDKFDVKVVTLTGGSGRLRGRLGRHDISFKNLDAKSEFDPIPFYQFGQVVDNFNPNVLVTSLFHSTIFGRILGNIKDVQTIISWKHSEDFGGPFRRWMEFITCSLSDKIIADSAKVKDVLIDNLPSNCSSKVVSIPIGGVKLDKFNCEWNCRPKKPIRIGTVGSLREPKGYLDFLPVIKDILEKRQQVSFYFTGDGPLKEKLTTKVGQLQIKDRINLLGYREDIPNLLKNWSVYVQPSKWEGLCITVVEAMAAGLPIVAYDVGGISESVMDGENGFLIPPGDEELFVDKILTLIDDEYLRETMGKESRKIAEGKYSITKMVNRFEKVIVETHERNVQ